MSFDGTPIFYTRVNPETENRAVLLIVHGMGEHGARYQSLAESIAVLGVEVWRPDLRGFGRSGGRMGFCRSFSDYQKDLEALYRHVLHTHPGKAIFILGHSMGGLISAYTLARSSVVRPKGVIFSSPLFAVAVKVPCWQKFLGLTASVVCPSFTQDNRVNPDDLTHDAAMREAHRKDPLIHSKISARLYKEILSATRERSAMAARIHCPVLLLQAGEDRIVSSDASLLFYDELSSSNREKELYQGFYHEILNETDRAVVYGRIAQWLVKQF